MRLLLHLIIIGGLAWSIQVMNAATLKVCTGCGYKQLKAAVIASYPGDTIQVHKGVYFESDIEIRKSLVLIGVDQPWFDATGQGTILKIMAHHVSIEGLGFQNTGYRSAEDWEAIEISNSSYISIRNNRFENCQFGLHISNSQHCEIVWNAVRGTPGREQVTGNAIHLWQCKYMRIAHNHTSYHRDGIYLEFTTHSSVKSNMSEHNIRYGLHFMFSHHNEYYRNTFRLNGAGVAVMYTQHVNMFDNVFELNQGASSYGLLLKDISDSRIMQNTFSHNTNGLYMEGSNRSEISENIFSQNGWALRIQASCEGNAYFLNIFRGNSFDLATNGKLVLNKLERNYWDKYEGYDIDKDGYGDRPFYPMGLYGLIVEKLPIGILFLKSTVVSLIDKAEKILPSVTPVELKDSLPLMRIPDYDQNK